MAFFDLNGNDRTDFWEWLVLLIGLNYLAERSNEDPDSRVPTVSNVQAARRSLVWGVVLSPLVLVAALFIHVSTIPALTDEAYEDVARTYEHRRAVSDVWVDEREIVDQVRAEHGLEGFPIGASVVLLGVPYAWWRLRRSRKLLARPTVDPWFHQHGDVLAHSHPHDGVHTHGPDGSMLPPHPPAPSISRRRPTSTTAASTSTTTCLPRRRGTTMAGCGMTIPGSRDQMSTTPTSPTEPQSPTRRRCAELGRTGSRRLDPRPPVRPGDRSGSPRRRRACCFPTVIRQP